MWILTTTNELKYLYCEFNLADATGTQLEVILQSATAHFITDHRLHAAHGFVGAVIQIQPVGERTQDTEQATSFFSVFTGHDSGFDHGVAFPVSALGVVVLAQGGKIHHQWATLAIGPQAHIDTEDEAIHGFLIQRQNQFLTQTGKELLVADAFFTVGITALAKGKNQVNVRTQVQLPASQLTHAQHQQLLRLA